MATRNLRTRMSSRLSSPAVHAEPAAETSDKNVEMTDDVIPEDEEPDDGEWREPPVRVLPPSFKDHKGIERVGVLEHQQPLGVPPSQKLLQRLKLNFTRPSNRATPLPDDEIMSQGLDSEAAETGSPMDADVPAVEEIEQMAMTTPPRGRPSNKDMAAMQSAYPMGETPSPVQANFNGTPQQATDARPMSIQDHLRQERVQVWVSKAVEDAQEHGDLGLVPGLQNISRNGNDKRNLWRVLEAVCHKNPTPEQLHVFKKLIKKGLHKYQRQTAASGGAASKPFLGVDNGIASERPVRSSRPTFTSPFRTRAATSGLQSSTPASQRRTKATADHSSPAKKSTRSHRKRRRTSDASISSSSSLSSARSVSTQSLENDVSAGVAQDEDAELDGRGASQDGRQAGEATSAAPRLRLVNKNSSIPPPDSNTETTQISSKSISEKLKKSQQAPSPEAEAKSFKDYNYIERREVDERHHVPEPEDDESDFDATEAPPPPPVLHPNPIGRKADSATSLHLDDGRQPATLMNGAARKRDFDEFAESDDESEPLTPLSSSPAPYEPPPPPPNALLSRSATPRITLRNSGPPAKAARKSARVISSPNKPKNGGITAGFTRAGPPARLAELGGGADASEENLDNDEHCASCGGEGTLLCCDGCTNSFHHSCLEPPLNPDEEVEGAWYCPRCEARHKKSTEESKTFLGRALGTLDHVIPRAFALPLELREYFEGVRTGEEGEYTEFSQPPTRSQQPKQNKYGAIEEPNYKEPRDSKSGKYLFCNGCDLGANGKDLIPCDYCTARWHLDCLNPPLAVPPRKKLGDKANATWRCPLHVEHELRQTSSSQQDAAPGDLGGVPKRRKPKNAKPRDVDFPRGFRHNGIIEVQLDDEIPKLREVDMDGQVFRLPEQAIKLDFIDRVKRSWYEDKTFPYTANGRRPPRFVERDYRPTRGVVLHEPEQQTITIKEPEFYKGSHALSIVETAKTNAELRRKTLPEQEAVLSLTGLARADRGPEFADSLADLTNAMIAEAPREVTELQVRDERQKLQYLQALIERRMGILDGREGDLPPLPAPPPAAVEKADKPEKPQKPEKPNRLPYNKYSRAPTLRAEQKEAMWNVTRERNLLRSLQPAPPAVSNMSPTNPQQGQFGAADPMQNGAHLYGAAPPPQPGQQVAYPFSQGAPGGHPEFSGQGPLQANVSPWQPPSASPTKSPFAPHQAGSPIYGGRSFPGTPGSGLPSLAPAPIAGQPGIYGPPPPNPAGMQRQLSAAESNIDPSLTASNPDPNRRASLQGPIESNDNAPQARNDIAFAIRATDSIDDFGRDIDPALFSNTSAGFTQQDSGNANNDIGGNQSNNVAIHATKLPRPSDGNVKEPPTSQTNGDLEATRAANIAAAAATTVEAR
ncbi:Transcriptional regulatory protein RCO1 [Cyphellophora attinorum]|uniref:Transcriptional regulatory protein RCO1 n=1 Tax=Cyphellophora attinorum TaxID=1664694 RepID=A0A0N0NS56_9EURO|nr:Transcriptional regulatory protein RCO1 [Phialophora attinorum]KPI45868.1 Transcriptional regulatory protein RCO1 [Phialophora attinorum]